MSINFESGYKKVIFFYEYFNVLNVFFYFAPVNKEKHAVKKNIESESDKFVLNNFGQ